MILNLRKLQTELKNPVEYKLKTRDSSISLNQLIGKKLGIFYQNKINCIHCGRETKKSFAQGYCYPCFISLPQTDECILKPELCKAHEGVSRDIKWAEENCLQDHYVYLALSSHVKVGVTRNSQVPTRWIDQGASKAIKIACTPNRYTAGLMEVDLKQYFSDKTSWQKMLKNEIDDTINLVEKKQEAYDKIDSNFYEFFIDEDQITEIEYPVKQYPKKVSSINLDKNHEYTGILVGIKGQYLIFEDNKVINIRKYGGYLIDFEF